MKRSRRSVAWDHFELKNYLVHCQHCEAIPEAGGDKEPALSDTDEGSANTGAAARLAKLARSYLCIRATRPEYPSCPERSTVRMLAAGGSSPASLRCSASCPHTDRQSTRRGTRTDPGLVEGFRE
ncbi:unnamed protein product [Pleuronectes platessa]|uniref:Uncharacterized protein n=1 Tax=Pleuronectes platessa TaxID=8262 RepID=A0A9N7UQN9_PLEPL|nr:unnamed protein product [Pleuronectes platessa]